MNQNMHQPFIIEVIGTPNSGKTGAIKKLETTLKRTSNLKIKIISEAAAICPIKDKYNLKFNLWTACSTLNSLIECLSQEYDLIVCERGIYDSINWFNVYRNDQMVSLDCFDRIKNFFDSDFFTSSIKYVIAMTCDVETSIRRDNLQNINIQNVGSIVNEHVLSLINASMDETLRMISSNGIDHLKIDTSKITQETAESIFVTSVLNYLELDIKQK